MKMFDLYDLDSVELFECINNSKIALKNSNTEYREKFYKIERLKNRYPKIREILEDEIAHELTLAEGEALVKIVNLYYDLFRMEEYEIFLAGGRECIGYLSKMGVL